MQQQEMKAQEWIPSHTNTLFTLPMPMTHPTMQVARYTRRGLCRRQHQLIIVCHIIPARLGHRLRELRLNSRPLDTNTVHRHVLHDRQCSIPVCQVR